MYCIQIERGVLHYAIRGRRSKQDIPLHHDDSSADDFDPPADGVDAPADGVDAPAEGVDAPANDAAPGTASTRGIALVWRKVLRTAEERQEALVALYASKQGIIEFGCRGGSVGRAVSDVKRQWLCRSKECGFVPADDHMCWSNEEINQLTRNGFIHVERIERLLCAYTCAI